MEIQCVCVSWTGHEIDWLITQNNLFINIKLTQAGLELFIIIMIYVCVHYIEMLYMRMCTSQINRKSKWLFRRSSVTKFCPLWQCVCVRTHARMCPHPRLFIINSVMWHDMDSLWLLPAIVSIISRHGFEIERHCRN